MKLFSPSAVWKNYRQGKNIRNIIDECPGWCRLDKALAFAQIIRQRDIKLSVEIGVYGGRSLLSQALAHKEYTAGLVKGIDPWSAQEAMQYGEGAVVGMGAVVTRSVEPRTTVVGNPATPIRKR